MVAIETDTKKLFNSAGELATGFVLLRLPAELETGDGLMLTTRGRWAVKAGVFVDGATKTLPAGAEVEIVHVFNVDDDSGRGVRKDRTTRWVEVPAGTTLEYVDLITDHVTVPPAAGPGVPAWAAELLEAVGDMETLTDITMAAVAADEGSAFSVQQRATFGAVTITVAASDTQTPFRTRATYFCDGVNDIATIQAALDALPNNAAVSGEVVLLPGNYVDASGDTLSLSSPTSGSIAVRKVLRFQRGARLNVTNRTGRVAVIKLESPDCQLLNPNVAGETAKGDGTGIAVGGDIATFGGRYNSVPNRCRIISPIITNCETGVEFTSIDGTGSVGDCEMQHGYIWACSTGIRSAGYTNTVLAPTVADCDINLWVEARRVESRITVLAPTLINWATHAIYVQGGFGTKIDNAWMERNGAATGSPTTAIKIGNSTTDRPHMTKFTGNTHVQLSGESYAVDIDGAIGLLIEDLTLSTSGSAPATSVVRFQGTENSRNNRIRQVSFGPSTPPAHTLLTGTFAGELIIERIPLTSGPFRTTLNADTVTMDVPFIRKSADESYTSNTNMHNDASLVLTVQINSTYIIEGLINYEADAAGDLKGTLAIPAGGSLVWEGIGLDASDAPLVSTQAHTVEKVYGGAGAATPRGVIIRGVLTTGATAGVVRWRWAQGTSSATATKVLANSYLRATKVA